MSVYIPPTQDREYFLNTLTKLIDLFCSKYEHYLIMGDFNMELTESALSTFLSSNNLSNLMKMNTCFKATGSCIDLILTNRKHAFKHSESYKTAITDHHHLIYTMLKSCFQNKEPKVLNYRDFRSFSSKDFKQDLAATLNDCANSYDVFEQRFVANLNKHAPKKLIRGNNKPHMNKMLRQAIRKRSRLKNKTNKTKTHLDVRNYEKQQNIAVNLNKEAKLQYFNNYDLTNTKTFWENYKPYFSNEHSKADTDIILNENGDLILKIDKIMITLCQSLKSISLGR